MVKYMRKLEHKLSARGMLVLSINLLYIIHTGSARLALTELFIQHCNYAFVISRIISRLAADD